MQLIGVLTGQLGAPKVTMDATSWAQVSSETSVRRVYSSRPRLNVDRSQDAFLHMYVPRPGIFPVGSIEAPPSSEATIRLSSLLGALAPQATQLRIGTCRPRVMRTLPASASPLGFAPPASATVSGTSAPGHHSSAEPDDLFSEAYAARLRRCGAPRGPCVLGQVM